MGIVDGVEQEVAAAVGSHAFVVDSSSTAARPIRSPSGIGLLLLGILGPIRKVPRRMYGMERLPYSDRRHGRSSLLLLRCLQVLGHLSVGSYHMCFDLSGVVLSAAVLFGTAESRVMASICAKEHRGKAAVRWVRLQLHSHASNDA